MDGGQGGDAELCELKENVMGVRRRPRLMKFGFGSGIWTWSIRTIQGRRWRERCSEKYIGGAMDES